MVIKVEVNQVVPKGFLCAGCSRLGPDAKVEGRYYCYLFYNYLEKNKNGLCIKHERCLQEIRKALISEGE